MRARFDLDKMRLGVRVVVVQSLEAGRSADQARDDVVAAFRAAVAGDCDTTYEEMDLELDDFEYSPILAARALQVTLFQTGLNPDNLVDQESLWEAVRTLADEEIKTQFGA